MGEGGLVSLAVINLPLDGVFPVVQAAFPPQRVIKGRRNHGGFAKVGGFVSWEWPAKRALKAGVNFRTGLANVRTLEWCK